MQTQTSLLPPLSRRQQKIRAKEKLLAEQKKKKTTSYVNQSPFRYCERNFKSRVGEPDFTHVVDFDNLTSNTQEIRENIVEVELTQDLCELSPIFGQTNSNVNHRKAFVLKSVPGLIIIPNNFTPQAQRSLIKQCLSVYPTPPNTSNLNTHYVIPSSGIWPLYEAQENNQLNPTDPGFYVPKKIMNNNTDSTTYSDSEEEEEEEEEKEGVVAAAIEKKQPPTACSDDFKPVIKDVKSDPLPAPGVPLLPPNELVRKLRWVTLGYQYHWTTKTYHLDRHYPFPKEVAHLTKAVVTACEGIGYDTGNEKTSWKNTYKGEDYNAEAGVVNYYQYRDTLMGHVDRSELNMEAPLVSLSLGHSCIYLCGGLTRDTVPIPLLLKSGDIIVMTEPCRKAFHGVPLIIENSLPDYLLNKNQYEDCEDWKLFGEFMSTSRINLNVRQVYPKGGK